MAKGGMTGEEYKLLLEMAQTSTPTLEEYQEMRAFDSNVEWRLPRGTISNLLELALERIEELEEEIKDIEEGEMGGLSWYEPEHGPGRTEGGGYSG